MNLDAMIREAQERVHRSIGQRVRHARVAIRARAFAERGAWEANHCPRYAPVSGAITGVFAWAIER